MIFTQAASNSEPRPPILPNLALIGCGAIAQAFYLPAIAKHRERFRSLWLVDPSAHALNGAAAIVPGRQVRQLQDIQDEIQLVIVATPNNLHCSIALEALARGAHTLVEKPFVIGPEEGRALLDAAAANNRVVAINQTRRLHPIAAELRRRIANGDFGTPTSITHPEGTKLVWPFESGAGFAPGAVRTGVIMDFGVHVLDFYHYVMQPSWTFISAVHDGFDGPEGLAEIELQADGVPVSVRLSRYYPQDNVARLAFEDAEVSFQVYDDAAYVIRQARGGKRGAERVRVQAALGTAAERMILNFLASAEKRELPVCDATSSMPVITILDEIYRGAQRYPSGLGCV